MGKDFNFLKGTVQAWKVKWLEILKEIEGNATNKLFRIRKNHNSIFDYIDGMFVHEILDFIYVDQ